MKKFLCSAILISMMLHCACRIGFLSYLYEQRNQIAFAVGLIEEVPITSCSFDYYHEGFYVENLSNNSHETVPLVLTTAHEIILFFQTSFEQFIPAPSLLAEVNYAPYVSDFYKSPLKDIFQPPRI